MASLRVAVVGRRWRLAGVPRDREVAVPVCVPVEAVRSAAAAAAVEHALAARHYEVEEESMRDRVEAVAVAGRPYLHQTFDAASLAASMTAGTAR